MERAALEEGADMEGGPGCGPLRAHGGYSKLFDDGAPTGVAPATGAAVSLAVPAADRRQGETFAGETRR